VGIAHLLANEMHGNLERSQILWLCSFSEPDLRGIGGAIAQDYQKKAPILWLSEKKTPASLAFYPNPIRYCKSVHLPASRQSGVFSLHRFAGDLHLIPVTSLKMKEKQLGQS
jgi:hypothetical protein